MEKTLLAENRKKVRCTRRATILLLAHGKRGLQQSNSNTKVLVSRRMREDQGTWCCLLQNGKLCEPASSTFRDAATSSDVQLIQLGWMLARSSVSSSNWSAMEKVLRESRKAAAVGFAGDSTGDAWGKQFTAEPHRHELESGSHSSELKIWAHVEGLKTLKYSSSYFN